MDEAELRALAEKLRELLALRALGAEDAPADRLRALAARFPGALRELDRAPLERLTSRLEEVERALEGGQAPAWAKPASRYHGWLRIAFRLRAEAARTEDAALAWAAAYVPVLPGDPARERLDVEVLRLLVDPPGGRLVRVAAKLAAEECALSEGALDALIHGR